MDSFEINVACDENGTARHWCPSEVYRALAETMLPLVLELEPDWFEFGIRFSRAFDRIEHAWVSGPRSRNTHITGKVRELLSLDALSTLPRISFVYVVNPRMNEDSGFGARRVYVPRSPWVQVADRLAEGCRANAALDIKLGLAFREVQQEAYRSWDAFDREFDEAVMNDNATDASTDSDKPARE